MHTLTGIHDGYYSRRNVNITMRYMSNVTTLLALICLCLTMANFGLNFPCPISLRYHFICF